MTALQGSSAGEMAADRARVLLVDDDPIIVGSLSEFLRGEGHDVDGVTDGSEALEALATTMYTLVITDINMARTNGLELLRVIKQRFPELVVIVITGYGTIESAVDAVKMGAFEYLTKPVIDDEIRVVVERAIKQQKLLSENRKLKQALDLRYGLDNIVGHDYKMLKCFDLVEAVAESKTTVLMTGESGTGKSLVARAIHFRSPRRDKPFVEVSCGAIPESLLESELFGHVKGSFTGATADKPGRFLAANGGTLFLDEINSASPSFQVKLLRVLQERKFEPVGSNQTISVDVRVVLASNQDLARLVEEGTFRQDLYYRINVVNIQLPPLRERLGDIPLLAENFLKFYATEMNKRVSLIAPECIDALLRYSWPGNVRELENVIERAVVLTKRGSLGVEDLPTHVLEQAPKTGTGLFGGASHFGSPQPGPGGQPHGVVMSGSAPTGAVAPSDDPMSPAYVWKPMPLKLAIEEPEKRIIAAALKANRYNRQATSEQLDINRTTLYKKMKRYGLDMPEEG
jgi:two-component system response regulator AtoC